MSRKIYISATKLPKTFRASSQLLSTQHATKAFGTERVDVKFIGLKKAVSSKHVTQCLSKTFNSLLNRHTFSTV